MGKADQEIVDACGEVIRQAVPPEEIDAEFGKGTVRRSADGKWRAMLTGEQVKRFDEMDRGRQRADVARGAAIAADVPTVKIRGADGRPMRVPEKHAERIEREMHFRRTGRR